MAMKKYQIHNSCLECEYHNKRKVKCKDCDGSEKAMKHLRLYDADPNCKHNIVTSSSGGVHCTKCSAWFCF